MLRLGALAVVAALVGALWLLGSGASSATRLGNLQVLSIPHANHSAVVRLLTRRRVVALSFDDGPDPRFSLRALRILRRFGVRATFFVVGRSALARPDLIRAELRAGGEVENHTYDHTDLRRLSAAQTRLELARGRAALLHLAAPAPTLFRAPYGNFTAAAAHDAALQHELMVAWTLTIERALNGRSVNRAVQWMMSRVRPGAIILAHDGRLDRSRTLLALPVLLQALRRRGYSVVSVSALLRIGGEETRGVLRRLGAVL